MCRTTVPSDFAHAVGAVVRVGKHGEGTRSIETCAGAFAHPTSPKQVTWHRSESRARRALNHCTGATTNEWGAFSRSSRIASEQLGHARRFIATICPHPRRGSALPAVSCVRAICRARRPRQHLVKIDPRSILRTRVMLPARASRAPCLIRSRGVLAVKPLNIHIKLTVALPGCATCGRRRPPARSGWLSLGLSCAVAARPT
jgi:hypothetical protein